MGTRLRHKAASATMRQGASRNTGPFTNTYPASAAQAMLDKCVSLYNSRRITLGKSLQPFPKTRLDIEQ